MSDIVHTDLTRTDPDPGPRAEVDPENLLEPCNTRLTLPAWLGGGTIEIGTQTRATPVLVSSLAVLLLTVSGGLVAGIAKMAGLSGWPLVATAVATPPLYGVMAFIALAYLLDRQARNRRAG